MRHREQSGLSPCRCKDAVIVTTEDTEVAEGNRGPRPERSWQRRFDRSEYGLTVGKHG